MVYCSMAVRSVTGLPISRDSFDGITATRHQISEMYGERLMENENSVTVRDC